MWWMLLGCVSPGRVALLELELQAAQEQIASLDERLAALERPQEQDDRDEARNARLERLAELRRERELAGLDPTDDPLELLDPPDLTVRQALSDADHASRLARLMPHRGPDGDDDGFRISALRRGSLLDRLGLRNGDVVHAIDGLPLRSMEEAMLAYALLARPEVTEVTVSLTRRGSPETLRVALDEPPPSRALEEEEEADMPRAQPVAPSP